MTRSLTFLIFVAALVPLAGCGKKLTPVSGVVTLDGKPVADATVTFVSDDGKYTSTGSTDASGNFTLSSRAGPGAYPGNYKVSVAKYAKVEGSAPTGEPAADKDYMKQMKNEMDASKKQGAAKTAPAGKMGVGLTPPAGMMPAAGAGAAGSVPSLLPEIYASIDKSPFTAKVPSEGPVQLDLKSKP